MIPFIVISYACFALCIVVVLLGRKGTEEDKNLQQNENTWQRCC